VAYSTRSLVVADRAADAGLDADAGTVTCLSSPSFTTDVRFGGQLQRKPDLHRQLQTWASVRSRPDLNSTRSGSLLSACPGGVPAMPNREVPNNQF